jgi:hypothetical protein
MINTDLNHLKKWSNRWLLKFNSTKTEIIIFNVNGVGCNLIFNFEKTTIDPVHTHKHLGIVFSKLSFHNLTGLFPGLIEVLQIKGELMRPC